jgi:hypothetical protein
MVAEFDNAGGIAFPDDHHAPPDLRSWYGHWTAFEKRKRWVARKNSPAPDPHSTLWLLTAGRNRPRADVRQN